MSEPTNIELAQQLLHLSAQMIDDRLIEKNGKVDELLFACATALGKSAQIVSSPTADASYATILFQTDLRAFDQNPFHIDTPFGRPVVIHRGNAFAEPDAEAPVEANEKYLIWSAVHHAWWGQEQHGYTKNQDRAGRYSREDAISICAHARDGWTTDEIPHEFPVPEADVTECRERDLESYQKRGADAQ